MSARCYDSLDSVETLSLNCLTLLRSSVEFCIFEFFTFSHRIYISLLHLSNRQTVWFVSVSQRSTDSRFIFRISCSVHNEIHFSFIYNTCNKSCYKSIQRFTINIFHLRHTSDLIQFSSP